MPLGIRRREQPAPAAATTTAKLNGSDNSPSVSTLQAEVATIHRNLKELARDREQLALPSLRGDAEALTRIADIDQERQQLALRLETCEAGIRALASEHRAVGWRQHLPRMRKLFRVEVANAWDHAPLTLERLMAGRQSHDLADLRAAITNIEAAESRAARTAAEWCILDTRPPFYKAGDQQDFNRARTETAKLNEARQRAVAEAVAELLKDTNLERPAALEAALELARKRLQIEAEASRRNGGRR